MRSFFGKRHSKSVSEHEAAPFVWCDCSLDAEGIKARLIQEDFTDLGNGAFSRPVYVYGDELGAEREIHLVFLCNGCFNQKILKRLLDVVNPGTDARHLVFFFTEHFDEEQRETLCAYVSECVRAERIPRSFAQSPKKEAMAVVVLDRAERRAYYILKGAASGPYHRSLKLALRLLGLEGAL